MIIKRRKIKTNDNILRFFPFIDDKQLARNLRIDNESIHYISIREIAEKITNIVSDHLINIIIPPQNAIITDATAGVGGNTISFGMYFKYVNAIEINETRANYLENNINIYNLTNIKVYNQDCTKLLAEITDHNVIFIDPPWGGRSYKKYKRLRLNISDITLETLCNKLLNKRIMRKTPELIVLKLPKNYDIKYLYNNIKNHEIYLHNLRKMYVIVIINNNR